MTSNTFVPLERNSAQADLLAGTPVSLHHRRPNNGAVSFLRSPSASVRLFFATALTTIMLAILLLIASLA